MTRSSCSVQNSAFRDRGRNHEVHRCHYFTHRRNVYYRVKSRPRYFATWPSIDTASFTRIGILRRCEPGKTRLLGMKGPKNRSPLGESGRFIGGARSARKGRAADPIVTFTESVDDGVTADVSAGPEGDRGMFRPPRGAISRRQSEGPIFRISSPISIFSPITLKF